jgi:hypothetical protein
MIWQGGCQTGKNFFIQLVSFDFHPAGAAPAVAGGHFRRKTERRSLVKWSDVFIKQL